MEMLPKAYILDWLKALVKKGAFTGPRRDGPTQFAIANYLGIPRNSLTCATNFEESGFLTLDRQRAFSKLIAQIENGQLIFVWEGNRKVAKLVDKPKPIARYEVHFNGTAPRLAITARPKAFQPMPSFKQVLLTPTKRTSNL